MIKQYQTRPQSKSFRSQNEPTRPVTKNLNQEQAEKCFMMAKQHQKRNEYDRAQKLYIEATIHSPNHFKSYCNLGLCMKIHGQYGKAIQYYLKAKSINPKDQITLYNLANVYRLIGDYQKSIQNYLIVIRLKQKENIQIGDLYWDSYNNMGICYKNLDNLPKAIECFEKILQKNSSDTATLFNLAVCEMRLVRSMKKSQAVLLFKDTISKTKKHFQQVVKSDQKNQVAIVSLLELSILDNEAEDNINKCVKELAAMEKDVSYSSFVKEQCSRLRAYCLALLKKYEESAEEYKKAMQKKKEEEERRIQEEKRKRLEEQAKIKKQQEAFQAKLKAEQQAKKNQQSIQAPKQTKTPAQTSQKSITSILTQVTSKQLFQAIVEQLFESVNQIVQSEITRIQNSEQAKASLSQTLQKTLTGLIARNVKKMNVTGLTRDFVEKIKNELTIIGLSIIGQKLGHIESLKQAYDLYEEFFVGNTMIADQKPSKDTKVSTQKPKPQLFLETHRAIASILTTLGYSQQAIHHFEVISQQLSSSPQKDPSSLQQLHSGLAINYESQGLYTQAINQFRQALQLKNDNFLLYYNLAHCQHCQGMTQDAIGNYEKFLQRAEKSKNDSLFNNDQDIKKSYILNAAINIFACFQGTLQQKIQKNEWTQQKMRQITQNNPTSLTTLIDQQSLMRYYLKSCDIYQQAVFQKLTLEKNHPRPISRARPASSMKSMQSPTNFKQKLFATYIRLLQFPSCPDRDQILINCGNILFEEKSYLNALNFYEKVSSSKTQVYNIIALTLLNLNEYERSIICMKYATDRDPKNKIYEINLEIMKWAYGMEDVRQDSLLWKMFPCQCDVDFQTRVEFAKCLVTKLSNFIEEELFRGQNNEDPSQQVQKLDMNKLFSAILEKQPKKDSLSSDEELVKKYNYLQKHLSEHKKSCSSSNITQSKVKQILSIALAGQEPSVSFSSLMSKLQNADTKKSTDYLTISQHMLSLFSLNSIASPQKQQKLKSLYTATIHVLQPHQIQLQFTDSWTSPRESYPIKQFTVHYPTIELKPQNIIQSLGSWMTQLQDEFSYLSRIVQAIAYDRNSLSRPVVGQYGFPMCKNLENCDKCFKKALGLFAKMFGVSIKDGISKVDVGKMTGPEIRKIMIQAFSASLSKTLQSKHLKPLPVNNNKIQHLLSFTLSPQILPMQLALSFTTLQQFEAFLIELCQQFNHPKPDISELKESSSVDLIINKLVKVNCSWKEKDFVQELAQNIVKEALDMKENVYLMLDQGILKDWAKDQDVKTMLQKFLGNEVLLK